MLRDHTIHSGHKVAAHLEDFINTASDSSSKIRICAGTENVYCKSIA